MTSTTTLYPVSHLTLSQDTECDPIYTAVCVAAGVGPSDEEVTVSAVDTQDADRAIEIAGRDLPSWDEPTEGVRGDCYYAVVGHDPSGYCLLVHRSLDGQYRRV